MTRYWLTTHWPRDEDDPQEQHPDVWVQEGKERVWASMAPGDRVFIYESRSGDPEYAVAPTGDRRLIARREGREAVIALFEVGQVLIDPPEIREVAYASGKVRRWRHVARGRFITTAGRIERRQLNGILGFDEGYVLRGFGDDHSGLKEISFDQFGALLEAFRAGRRQALSHARVGGSSTRSMYGSGGEGEEHRRLKLHVAEHPDDTIGARGIESATVEYSFETGDRADIVMEGLEGDLHVIEIEPDLGEELRVGVLQAIKYRALLAAERGRTFDEVRAHLVAPRIPDSVRALAARYDIHCHQVTTP